MMDRQEKIAAAKKMRDAVRKRVDRLEDIADIYGQVPSLRALEDNRRKYDMFDPETHKIAVKNADGSIKPITSMTDNELDKILKQGKDFMKLKTSSAKGAHLSIRSRTEDTMNTLSALGIDSPVVKDFNDLLTGKTGARKKNAFLDKTAKEMKDFWDVVEYLRKNHESVADKILNPNEYRDVFQEIFDKLKDPKLKNLTAKSIGKVLAKELSAKANELINEEKAKARKIVELSGGALPDIDGDDPFNSGRFKGNNNDVYTNSRMASTKRSEERKAKKNKRKKK